MRGCAPRPRADAETTWIAATQVVSASSDLDRPGDLPVRFPVSALAGDERVVLGRLDVPGLVDGPGGDLVLPGTGGRPVEVPELPGELVLRTLVDERGLPRAVVDLHLDARDRRTPGGSVDAVLPVHDRDSRRG